MAVDEQSGAVVEHFGLMTPCDASKDRVRASLLWVAYL